METILLQFHQVTVAPEPPFHTGLQEANLVLPRGGLVLVRVDTDHLDHPLADLAQGLVAPTSGSVFYDGVDWQQRSPGAASDCRGRIGRVFRRGGWISNLDLDENIMLAQRYHTGRTDEDMVAEMEKLAADLGMPVLPRLRPAQVNRLELRRAQWVRALLGRPELLLLDQPARELPAGWAAPLVRLVQERRAEGCTVLWITSTRDDWDNPALKPSLKFELKDMKMRRSEHPASNGSGKV